jgi:hypothetical protein
MPDYQRDPSNLPDRLVRVHRHRRLSALGLGLVLRFAVQGVV